MLLLLPCLPLLRRHQVLESEEKAYLQSIDELYAAEMKKRSAPQVPHALKARLDLFMVQQPRPPLPATGLRPPTTQS